MMYPVLSLNALMSFYVCERVVVLRGRVLWTWQKSGQLPILLIILLCNGWHPQTSTTFTNIMIIGKQSSHGWTLHYVLYNGFRSLSVSLWIYYTYSCTVRISWLTLVWVSVVGVYSVSLRSFSIDVCGHNSASVPSPSGQIHCNPSRADAGGVLVTLHSFTDAWWQTCCRLLSNLGYCHTAGCWLPRCVSHHRTGTSAPGKHDSTICFAPVILPPP